MPLPSSGQIDLNAIHVEAGGTSQTQASLNDSDIRAMIGKGSQASNHAFSNYHGVSSASPTITYKGRLQTTGNGFPNGSISLSSGSKIVVASMQLATAGQNNSYINMGGTNMTQAVRLSSWGTNSSGVNIGAGGDVAIYYLVSTASGSTYFSGNGGGGRSCCEIFEITGYNSSTPTVTGSSTSINNIGPNGSTASGSLTLNETYNGATIIAGRGHYGDNTVSPSSASISQVKLELASSHFSIYKSGVSAGNTTYTATSNNPVDTTYPYTQRNGLFVMAGASWK